MNTGNLQRRFSVERPQVYDKETHLVCLDVVEASETGEDGTAINGYSFIQVEIDTLIEYGHIKSQLIEAGFAQKDEFGLLMNAVDGIITAVSESSSWSTFKTKLDTADVRVFSEFCDFRRMCAEAAHEVVNAYL